MDVVELAGSSTENQNAFGPSVCLVCLTTLCLLQGRLKISCAKSRALGKSSLGFTKQLVSSAAGRLPLHKVLPRSCASNKWSLLHSNAIPHLKGEVGKDMKTEPSVCSAAPASHEMPSLP